MNDYEAGSNAFENIISAFRFIENNERIRENIQVVTKDLEAHTTELGLITKDIVEAKNVVEIPVKCEKAKETFTKVRECYAELAKLVPQNQYYKFHDLWRYTTRRLICIAALLTYLTDEQFLDLEGAAAFLGVYVNPSDGFHVDLSSYFLGLLMFAQKLARLCTNLVVHGNYVMPVKIAGFLSELRDGFSQLNLKNDLVRRKYDGLKYDVKSTMEITLDLAMHGLDKVNEETTDTVK